MSARVHKVLGNERVGIYELKCTRCKHHLRRTSGEAWWMQPLTQYGDGVFRYRFHLEDEGMLDLRFMWCHCKESFEAAPLYWIWHQLPIREHTYKLTIHTNNGDDPEYYRDTLLRLATEMGVALTITIE